MINKRRDFIPGPCADSPKAAPFLEIDQGNPDEQLVQQAQAICQTCPQLSHCRDQAAGIMQELGNRGIERAVAGGLALSADAPNPEEEPRLQDPRFEFDLTYPLTDPRHALEVIRQGFRSRQLPATGNVTKHYETLAPFLHKKLSAQENYADLSPDETLQAVHIVARSFLKYRAALHRGWTRNQLRQPMSEEERQLAADIQEIFMADALEIKEANWSNPVELAYMHKAEFYKKIQAHYAQNSDITPSFLQYVFERIPIDPLAAIADRLARSRQLRLEGKPRAALHRPDMFTKISETNELMRKHASWHRHTKHMPELKSYLKHICNNNPADADKEVKALFTKVRTLEKEHPDIPTAALLRLTYYHRDRLDNALQTYQKALADLRTEYPGHPAFNEATLQRFAYTHLEKALAFAKGYTERYDNARATCEEADVQVMPTILRTVAERYQKGLTASEIKQLNDAQITRTKTTQNLPLLEAWMFSKAVQLYERAETSEVMKYLSHFLQRKYLKIQHFESLDDLPECSTEYDIIDRKKGVCLVIDEQLSYFSQEEQDAILASFGLDRFVLGRKVDTEKLCEHFSIADLTELVDNFLLPYTRTFKPDVKNPQEVLLALRTKRRHGVVQPQHMTDQKQSFQAKKFAILMAKLSNDSDVKQDLSDAACQKGLRLLVVQLENMLWQFRREQSMAPVAKAYLEDVRAIKELGCRDPYTIALGYDAAYCKRLFDSLSDAAWEPRPGYISDVLAKNTTGQATNLIRRFQRIARQYLPHFQNRNIGLGILKNACAWFPDKIGKRLALYDEVVQTYPANSMATVIHYFCFSVQCDNPLEEIKEWRRTVANVDSSYRHFFGLPVVRDFALSKRGAELTKAMDARIEAFRTLAAHYTRSPHPAIDDNIIKQALRNPSTAEKQLGLHIKRWEKLHKNPELAEKLADINPEVLRILVFYRRHKPEDAVRIYLDLQDEYRFDDYIDLSMIDEAMKWSVRHAMISVARLRTLLKKTDTKKLSMDREFGHGTGGRTFTLHDRVGDPAGGADEEVLSQSQLDPEAPTREQTQLLTMLNRLPPVEQAAVALVYQVPWVLPQQTQDDGWTEDTKVCQHFQVHDVDQLGPIVEKIIAKLAQSPEG